MNYIFISWFHVSQCNSSLDSNLTTQDGLVVRWQCWTLDQHDSLILKLHLHENQLKSMTTQYLLCRVCGDSTKLLHTQSYKKLSLRNGLCLFTVHKENLGWHKQQGKKESWKDRARETNLLCSQHEHWTLCRFRRKAAVVVLSFTFTCSPLALYDTLEWRQEKLCLCLFIHAGIQFVHKSHQ